MVRLVIQKVRSRWLRHAECRNDAGFVIQWMRLEIDERGREDITEEVKDDMKSLGQTRDAQFTNRWRWKFVEQTANPGLLGNSH